MTLIISFIVLGVILLLIEILVVPGVGIPGFIGFFLILLAIYLGFKESTETGLITLASGGIITGILSVYAFRSKTWDKFSLKSTVSGKTYRIEDGSLSAGNEGITITRINPMGKARFGDIDVEVKSFSTFIEEGKAVEIVEISGNSIVVKPKS